MTNEKTVEVDIRALSELRQLAQEYRDGQRRLDKALEDLALSRDEGSTLEKQLEDHVRETANLETETTKLRSQLQEAQQHGVKLETETTKLRSQLQEAQQLHALTTEELRVLGAREQTLRENNIEINDGLRKAQRAYLDTANAQQELEAALEQERAKTGDVTLEAERLANQIHLIKASRSWKAITRYRKFVKRISG